MNNVRVRKKTEKERAQAGGRAPHATVREGPGALRLHCTETSTALRREKGVWMVGLRGPWSGPCGRRNRGIVGGRRGGPSACVRWQERGRGSTRALTVAARRFVGLRLGSPPRPRGRAAGSPIVRWGLKKRELKNSQRARLLTKKLAKGSAKAVLDQVGGLMSILTSGRMDINV